MTAFDKFATMDAGHAKSLMDSHPASDDRAQHMRERIAADKSKTVPSSGLVSRQPAIIAQFFHISLQTNRVLHSVLTIISVGAYNARRSR